MTNAPEIERITCAPPAPDTVRGMPAFGRSAATGPDPMTAAPAEIRAPQPGDAK
jgi:hypothetical protein